ncbi:hypothetical protein QA601_11415 [Chitinispirillales bacterium ANBcel5]|uniref:hypothetical protein n=1 Tax=Cellulosispirillum alkaliphilum TaxID=3039283 RepID=UPI002A585AF1|nr:hypothetical protein [Chitinispirillales bacterium ANBcel5]
MPTKKGFKLFSFITALFCTTSYGFVGAGIHYGLDFSLDMKSASPFEERVSFIKDPVTISLGANEFTFSEEMPFMFVSRSNWQRTLFNLGGKAYLDKLPFLDGMEISANFGVWEYLGFLHYIDVHELKNSATVEDIEGIMEAPESNAQWYTDQAMTLEEFDLSYLGMKNTPYARLHIDLSARKNLVSFPPFLNVINVYSGAGISMHFSTPILSNKLIENVISDNNFDLEMLQSDPSEAEEVWEKVVERIIDGLARPTFGAHILLGTSVKIPAIPVGIYFDGKLLMPIGSLNPDVDLRSVGFLLNSGISLSF